MSVRLDAKLLLVGDGPEKESLEALAVSLGIQEDVIFTGKRSDMPELLAISDLMIHLSEKEAFGLVLLRGACLRCAVYRNKGGRDSRSH